MCIEDMNNTYMIAYEDTVLVSLKVEQKKIGTSLIIKIIEATDMERSLIITNIEGINQISDYTRFAIIATIVTNHSRNGN